MKPDTILQHLGEEERILGAVTPPIFQTSLFVHENVAAFQQNSLHERGRGKGYTYSRVGNPNLTTLERKIAALEGTEECRVFASGMAAISAAVLSSVQTGSHIVAVDTIYGPSRMLLESYLPKFGVTTTFVDGRDTQELLDSIRPETSLIYLESPSSLLFRLQDFRSITQVAREKGIRTLTDNSYASPLFQRPAEMGVDMICHSGTKYFAGHSDVVCGVLAGSAEILGKMMDFEGQLLGGLLPPFPAWLMLRGMRTLRLRMNETERRGNEMFEFLKSRPEVAEIFHIGDPNHPQRELIESQMGGHSSGLISFIPKEQSDAKLFAFADALEIFQLGVSWGGHESLCVLPKLSDGRWLIRLYVGLEDFEDLTADLGQAFCHLS